MLRMSSPRASAAATWRWAAMAARRFSLCRGGGGREQGGGGREGHGQGLGDRGGVEGARVEDIGKGREAGAKAVAGSRCVGGREIKVRAEKQGHLSLSLSLSQGPWSRERGQGKGSP